MLEVTVFLCGALVMVLEMTGARVLAPHVGTSAIVWTSIIGIVLAFLAAGAWAGGKYADRHLSARGLSAVLAGAALGCGISAFFHVSIGTLITSHIQNLYVEALLAAIAIFALPAFFFGMITPYVIRLRIAKIDTAGATVGRIYALSTTGSILGTFLGGFLLISFFSSTSILWGTACSMIILSIINSGYKVWFKICMLAIFLFLAWQDHEYGIWLAEKGIRNIIESPYNSIRITEGTNNGRSHVRLISTDPGYAQSGMLINAPEQLYFDYTKFYALGPKYVPDAKSILMLGGGGYSVPKWLLAGKSAIRKDFNLKVVEIDPEMTKIAKKYFALPEDDRLEIIHEDARAFLNRQKDKFDLIFMDVFNSHYSIPFQMGTEEAIKAVKNALAPDGALVMNIISAINGEKGRLFQAIWQNLRKYFNIVNVYCVNLPQNSDKIQNLMIVASDRALQRDIENYLTSKAIQPAWDEINKMEQEHRYRGEIEIKVPPLKDDFSPVERYTLMLATE